MKRMLLIALIAVGALVVASPAMAGTTTVQITKSGFVPDHVTIAQGDTVKWTNVDSATHQVVANDGTFASVALKTNDTYSFTFNKAGDFAYHDTYSKAVGHVVATPAPTPSVTLNSSQLTVVWGGSDTLTGSVSTGMSGQPVELFATEAGQPKTTQAVQVAQTTTGGTFSFSVNPTIRTAYEAHYLTAASQSVTVYVAPRVTLRLVSSGGRFMRFGTSATSNIDYNGHFVLFQRRNSAGNWYTLKVVRLGSGGTASFLLSRHMLPRGVSTLRIRMTGGQAGFGYIAGTSPTLAVRR